MGISALLAAQILDASATGRSVLTGADAAAIRTTLGLGTLATQSPTGTPSASTFLRGDFSWQTIDLSGYVPYTGATGALNLGANGLTANAATFNSRVTVNADILIQTSGGSPFVISGGSSGVNGRAKLGHASNTDGELSLRTLALSSNVGANRGDSFIHSDASNTLAQRNSTNAQTFRVYNLFTDASNYERAKIAWESNVLRIGTEKAGTGSARALELQTDGTTRLTIGSSGNITASTTIVASSGAGFKNNSSNQYFYWETVFLRSPSTNVLKIDGDTTGATIELIEMTAPSAPAANSVRIYAEDNGSGKTRLMALFATGVAQQIAIEP